MPTQEKELLISRIDDLHQGEMDGFKIMENRYDKWYQIATEDLRRKRNYVLSGAGVILTILVAFFSTNNIAPMKFVEYLIYDFVGGFVVFIGAGKILGFYSKFYDSITNSMYVAQDMVSHSRIFFSKMLIESPNLESEHLKNNN